MASLPTFFDFDCVFFLLVFSIDFFNLSFISKQIVCNPLMLFYIYFLANMFTDTSLDEIHPPTNPVSGVWIYNFLKKCSKETMSLELYGTLVLSRGQLHFDAKAYKIDLNYNLQNQFSNCYTLFGIRVIYSSNKASSYRKNQICPPGLLGSIPSPQISILPLFPDCQSFVCFCVSV